MIKMEKLAFGFILLLFGCGQDAGKLFPGGADTASGQPPSAVLDLAPELPDHGVEDCLAAEELLQTYGVYELYMRDSTMDPEHYARWVYRGSDSFVPPFAHDLRSESRWKIKNLAHKQDNTPYYDGYLILLRWEFPKDYDVALVAEEYDSMLNFQLKPSSITLADTCSHSLWFMTEYSGVYSDPLKELAEYLRGCICK